MFDRQEKEIEQLKAITKEEFKDFFNTRFFSEQARRIDFELNSSKHLEEQAKQLEENHEDPMFKTILKDRVIHNSMESFAASVEMEQDLFRSRHLKQQ